MTLLYKSPSSTDVLTITTNNSSMTQAEPLGGQSSGRLLFAISLLPLWALPLAGARRGLSRLYRLFALAVLAVGLGAICGCGGHEHLAAPGTYSIPITLQLSGGTTQQVTASVIVQ
jgi:hypothetical protein